MKSPYLVEAILYTHQAILLNQCVFYFLLVISLIAGDTLFKNGIGRTNLWGGDFNKIKNSILNKLFCLDELIKVITGHGSSTTIQKEKNLFLN